MRIWLVAVALVAAGCAQTVSDGCPDAYFVGVRGSGQEPGVGQQVADLYDQFVADFEGSAELVALDYPAAQGQFGDPAIYTASVEAGVAALPATIETLPCRNASVVLAGYSQGAHVITLADVGSVDAVVLMASPVFDPDDSTTKSGDFDPGLGGIIDETPVDPNLADRTIQVCLRGDPVCQAGALAVWVHVWGYAGEELADAAAFAASRV
jgi:cutinase-like protein